MHKKWYIQGELFGLTKKRRRLKTANEEKGHSFELDGRCRALVRTARSREGTKGSTLRRARNSAAWGCHLGWGRSRTRRSGCSGRRTSCLPGYEAPNHNPDPPTHSMCDRPLKKYMNDVIIKQEHLKLRNPQITPVSSIGRNTNKKFWGFVFFSLLPLLLLPLFMVLPYH